MTRGTSGLWLALLCLALGPGMPPASPEAAGDQAADDLLALLEFLGDEELAGDVWQGFFDSLPERPEDTVPLVPGPVPAGEATP